MREIKFRCWDRKHKKMFIQSEVGIQIFDDDFYSIQNLNGEVIIQPEHAVLMQYTGLKDKEGKDIYEDDFVEFDESEIGGGKGFGQVVFCNDLTVINAPGFYLFLNGFYRQFPLNCSVFGNVYQYPELLTTK